MCEEIGTFCGAEFREQFADPAAEKWNRSFGSPAQKRLQFAERLLDRVKVRRIFWQVKQFRMGGFDGLLNSNTFVGWEVIHDDDVAAPERSCQTLLEVADEGGSGHRPIQHERRDHLVMAKAGHEGDCLPMPLRHVTDQSLAAPASAAKPCHIG